MLRFFVSIHKNNEAYKKGLAKEADDNKKNKWISCHLRRFDAVAVNILHIQLVTMAMEYTIKKFTTFGDGKNGMQSLDSLVVRLFWAVVQFRIYA